MKQFFSWIGRKAVGGIITGIFLIATVFGIVYAINYPNTPPSGEISGGKFMTWFTNMRQTCPAGEIINGFKTDNSPNCISIPPSTPTGGIMAFNLSSCPAGWSPADGVGGRPDLRGEFIRGLDNGRGVDSGRTLGSSQVDMFKSHSHNARGLAGGIAGSSGASPIRDDGTSWIGNVIQATGGTETRPRNLAFLYCIKD